MSSVLRILVVDDVAAVAALHARFVQAHPQCEVVGTAASGPDAVAAILALQPDLVLLDVHLPGFSGIDALRAVRADAAITQPEVIAVTAARDLETVREARILGARHYLVKPSSADDLHARIEDVLAERAGAVAVLGPGSLDQSAVDAVMRPAGRRSLPKGLTPQTLDLVRGALRELGTASATELGEQVGLSRVSCRRYLEHIAAEGGAVRSLDYSTAGRPSTRYRVTG